MSRTRGKFITVEGVDGAGKTTQIEKLHQYLTAQDIDVIRTREPGGTPLAEHLRAGMLDPTLTEPVNPLTELLIIYAARQQHLDNVIRPALAKGQWVLCDRFVDTTFAYQIRGRCLAPQYFTELNRWVVRDTRPDLTLFFDLPHDVYHQRLQGRTEKSDRLDQEGKAFSDRVVAGLKECARLNGHHVIDATGSIDEVTERMIAVVSRHLKLPQLELEELL